MISVVNNWRLVIIQYGMVSKYLRNVYISFDLKEYSDRLPRYRPNI